MDIIVQISHREFHIYMKGGNVMPKETIMSKITDKEFEEIVESSFSLKEIAYKCGYSNNSGASCNIIKTRIA